MPMPRYKKWVVALIFLSVVGLTDATYLTVEHYRDVDPVCVIGPVGGLFDGCGIVTGSEYAVILGIPVALAGVLYYLVTLALFAALLQNYDRRLNLILAALTGAGLAASLWFVYLQVFVLHGFCFYCIVSACVTALLFIGSVVALRASPERISLPQEPGKNHLA